MCSGLAMDKIPLSNNTPVTRRVSNGTPTFMYPDECGICGQMRVRVGKDRESPLILTDPDDEKKIKESARRKPKYAELHHQFQCQGDLIGSNFRYHRSCRRALVKPCQDAENNVKEDNKFDALEKMIHDHVILRSQPLSIDAALQVITPSTPDDSPNVIRKRRERLKTKLKEVFGDRLIFLNFAQHPGMMISSDAVSTSTMIPETMVVEVAKHLRAKIEEYAENLPSLSWPPTMEELLAPERVPPKIVTNFYEMLLKHPNKGNVSPAVTRLINSYSWDMVHGVSRGKVITPKHFAFSTGIHALTGQRNAVQIAHGLGAGMSFDRTMDIITAQAQKAQALSREGFSLPVQPTTPGTFVKTLFWVDNLDKKIESENGGSCINMTVMMAFQELAEETEFHKKNYRLRKQNQEN